MYFFIYNYNFFIVKMFLSIKKKILLLKNNVYKTFQKYLKKFLELPFYKKIILGFFLLIMLILVYNYILFCSFDRKTKSL